MQQAIMLKVLLFWHWPVNDLTFLGNDVYVGLEFTPCTVIHDEKHG